MPGLSKLAASLALLGSLVAALPGMAQPAPATAAATVDRAAMANQVRTEFLHAWSDYERYAWGHDELMPLSRKPHDWYGQSLLMTPVDSLDTLILMGLQPQADKTRQLIDTQLSFDKDIYVKNFEITIRLLGGLLSSYELTGDKRLLALADDLGKRLLPVFDSPTGLPYVEVNLRTGKVRGTTSNPAETGSLLPEFGTLSRLTGNPVYYAKAKRAVVETYKRRSSLGLVGSAIDIETGRWLDTDSNVGGGIDSYLEYLWKSWLLFGDQDCLAMWKSSVAAADRYLADERDGQLWFGHADMRTGKRTATVWGALDAFFPGLLALSGDLDRARRLQDSSFRMWNLHGIEPEALDYASMRVLSPAYPLRPEIVESTYYLYHYTHDPKYLAMGQVMFRDFVKYCRSETGYAALKSVISKQQDDDMESFVFAETFKYYYLLFAPESTIELDRVVLNTEAHPLQRQPVASKR